MIKTRNFYIIGLWLCFSFFSNFTHSQTKQLDSLLHISENQPNDTNKVKLYIEIAEIYSKKDLSKALEYAQKADIISDKLSYKSGKASSLKILGTVNYMFGDYDLAEEYYLKSADLYQELGDKLSHAKITRNIGSIYSQRGLYEQALKYFFESLKVREQVHDSLGIASLYNAIGGVFYGQEDFDECLMYYHKSLEIYEKLSNKNGIADCYYRIGVCYTSQSEQVPDTVEKKRYYAIKAKSKYEKARELYDEVKNNMLVADCYEAIGATSMILKDIDSSFYYFSKSLEIRTKVGNKSGIASALHQLGRIYLERKNYHKAEIYFNDALQIAQEIQKTVLRKNLYFLLGELYAVTGEYKKAHNAIYKYSILADSLKSEEKTKAITQLRADYEYGKKLKERELEEQKRELAQQEQLKRQKIVTAFFISGFALMIILAFVIFRSYRQKQKANLLLAEKNNQILEKNAELKQANEEILAQRDEIEKQHIIVLHQNKQITDSIQYAKRIQTAVLPPDNFINNFLKEYFILFKPRDIVSGDFYWIAKKGKIVFLTAGDCTGHGVPGAFMSMLGMSMLNEIVSRIDINSEYSAAQILNQLREDIKNALRQTGKDDEAKDGMDMAFCIFDFFNNKLQYAGAENPLLCIRQNEIIQYKADRMPIGIYIKEKESFANNIIEIQKDDVYYIFSDGYEDQFGGPYGKKYLIKNLRDFLLKIHKEPMRVQRELLDENLKQWTSYTRQDGTHYEQVDDIIMIGIRIV